MRNVKNLFIFIYLTILIFFGIKTSCSTDLSPINKRNYYNEMYVLLTTNYQHFMKKIMYPQETIFKKLLSIIPNLNNFDDKNSHASLIGSKRSLYKKPADIYNIIAIIKNIFEMADKKNGLSSSNIDLYNVFIFQLETFLKQKNDIVAAFEYALYYITGNDKFYLKLKHRNVEHIMEDFQTNFFNGGQDNLFIITVCWILYAYPRVYSHLSAMGEEHSVISEDNLFIFSYPTFLSSINKIYDKIRFNDTLLNVFGKTMVSNEGLRYILMTEKYPKYINSSMAFWMINNQKNLFLELLLDEANKEIVSSIESCFLDITYLSKQIQDLTRGSQQVGGLYKLFGVTNVSVERYLQDYIPIDFWGPLQGSRSSKAVYGLMSMFKFYDQSVSFFVERGLDYYNGSQLGRRSFKSGWRQNFLLKTFFPLLSLSSMSIQPDEYFDLLERECIISGRNGEVWYRQSSQKDKNNNVIKNIWNDRDAYTLGDYQYQYRYIPMIGEFVNLVPGLPAIMGTAHYFISFFANGWRTYRTIKSLLTQVKGASNYYLYFAYMKKMIYKTKKLLDLLSVLYKKNNIDLSYMLPEMIEMKKLFDSGIKKNGVIKKIYELNDNKIKFIGEAVKNFLIPGLMTHFYFRELHESIEMYSLTDFIGSIDFAFAKKKLLCMKNIKSDLVFTIPNIQLTQNNILFDVKNMWYPSLKGRPIKNSLLLNENMRNIMIVGPVASGKTVLLSTILTVIYMSYMGIAPADSVCFTYFDYIFGHMEHSYEIGSGVSQHLAERASMKVVKEISNQIASSKKAIIIIDEIYKGTVPKLAVREAALDLPSILKKENIVTIVTTHLPEITDITKNENYSIKLYYLYVEYFSDKFSRTHKLFPDDENNWWMRNEDLALKYQLYLDKN